MCSGRVDLKFVLRAFLNGMDGVFIGGCRLNECNYITHGNYDALSMVYLCQRILNVVGVNPGRLKIEFMSSGEGNVFIESLNEFGSRIREIGPLGKSEGLEENVLKLKLEAAARLVPYIKLVERERLRIPVKSKDAYDAFFSSPELEKLFDELIKDNLVISQLMLLLKKTPLSAGEISAGLGLSPSQTSRYLIRSSKQGLVRYDEGLKSYAVA
jgi:coenzyme F420-reducing hydrogenase delta subunit